MRINNVGINVKDLEGAKKFFEDYFHAVEHAYYEEDNGFKEYILRLDEGAKLEIIQPRQHAFAFVRYAVAKRPFAVRRP